MKLMKAGEGSLKTGLFKWKPNYLEALPKFMEASGMFENAGDFANALKCYERLALCCEKQDDLAGAADAYDRMGTICMRQKKDVRTALGLFKKAGSLYKIQNNNLKAQEIMKKFAGYCFETNQEELGAEIYKEIIEELFDDQDYGTGAEVIPIYRNYLIRKEKYAEAISVYEKHIKYIKSIKKYPYIAERCWLSIVCIYIVMGEHFIADEKMSSFSADVASVRNSEEYSAALNLIDAIQKSDSVLFAKVLKRPIFTQIEIELLKKLKKCKMPAKVEARKAPQNELFGNAAKPEAPPAKAPEPREEEEKKTAVQTLEEEKVVVNPEATEKKEEPVKEVKESAEVKSQEEKPLEEQAKEQKSDEKTNDQSEPSADYGGIFT